jgi:hypothetical protein
VLRYATELTSFNYQSFREVSSLGLKMNLTLDVLPLFRGATHCATLESYSTTVFGNFGNFHGEHSKRGNQGTKYGIYAIYKVAIPGQAA